MRIINLLISILWLFNTVLANGQVNEEWVINYNGPANFKDVLYGIAIDDSDNVYVTGFTDNTVTNDDFMTMKYNSSGILQWIDFYNETGNTYDQGRAIALDNDGNVYVTGYSYSRLTTIKYDRAGARRWVTHYGDGINLNAYAKCIKVIDKNNIYSGGYIYNTNSYTRFILIKYDSAGTIKWAKSYGGPQFTSNYITSMAVDFSGNIYVTGYSNHMNSFYNPDFATIKYNVYGDSLWVKRYNGPGNSDDRPNSIDVDAQGNVYVTGSSRSTEENGSEDFATIKYDSFGNQKWVRRYNGAVNGIDIAYAVKSGSGGCVYVSGSSWGNNTGYDYLTVKYNSDGTELWSKRFNGSLALWDEPASIAVDNENNVYVTGKSAGITSALDVLTLKYNQNGSLLWEKRYNDTGNFDDYPVSIVLGKPGIFYIGGNTKTSSSYWSDNYLVIKYSEIIGVKKISENIPEKYFLNQNYPNPFNPATKIKFEIPYRVKSDNSQVKIAIFDVPGRKVEVLLNEKLSPGIYEVSWDAHNYPSGVYFYRLVTDEVSITKKMVLLK